MNSYSSYMLNSKYVVFKGIKPVGCLMVDESVSVLQQMVRRRPAYKDICPLELKSLRTEDDTSVFSLDEESLAKSSPQDKWKEEETPDSGDDMTKWFILISLT